MKSAQSTKVVAGAFLLVLVAALTSLPSKAQESAETQPLFTMDETVWATFYDLPSRRFRTIRDAFIKRDFAAADRDLKVSIGFLSIEANRTANELYEPISSNIATFEQIRRNIQQDTVNAGDLDAAFARAHWLLSQHFLVLSQEARNKAQHTNAGRYLRATAHHLERAVLWSDARISRKIVITLDDIRDMAIRLESDSKPERVYRDRPIAATARVLIEIGEHLKRKIWLPDTVVTSRAPG